MTLDLREANGGVQFAVKAVPGSSRDRIVGIVGAALKITVAAPPERGKANERIVELLAAALAVDARAIALVTGAGSARKTFRIAGLTAATFRTRLGL